MLWHLSFVLMTIVHNETQVHVNLLIKFSLSKFKPSEVFTLQITILALTFCEILDSLYECCVSCYERIDFNNCISNSCNYERRKLELIIPLIIHSHIHFTSSYSHPMHSRHICQLSKLQRHVLSLERRNIITYYYQYYQKSAFTDTQLKTLQENCKL